MEGNIYYLQTKMERGSFNLCPTDLVTGGGEFQIEMFFSQRVPFLRATEVLFLEGGGMQIYIFLQRIGAFCQRQGVPFLGEGV